MLSDNEIKWLHIALEKHHAAWPAEAVIALYEQPQNFDWDTLKVRIHDFKIHFERRFKAISFSEIYLMALIMGTLEINMSSLPEDVWMIRCGWDERTLGIFIILQSESYEPVPQGEIIPQLLDFSFRTRK